MQVLIVAAADLPPTIEFRLVASTAGDTCLSIPYAAFLGSATGLHPPTPSASSLSLGFCKIHCHWQTQSSMEW
jgi:hypothetical protein